MFSRIAVCGLLALSLGACGGRYVDLSQQGATWSQLCPKGASSCGLKFETKKDETHLTAYSGYDDKQRLTFAFVVGPESPRPVILLRSETTPFATFKYEWQNVAPGREGYSVLWHPTNIQYEELFRSQELVVTVHSPDGKYVEFSLPLAGLNDKLAELPPPKRRYR